MSGFELAMLIARRDVRRAFGRGRGTHRTVKFVYGDVWQVQERVFKDSATDKSSATPFHAQVQRKRTPPQIRASRRNDRELRGGATREGDESGGEGGTTEHLEGQDAKAKGIDEEIEQNERKPPARAG